MFSKIIKTLKKKKDEKKKNKKLDQWRSKWKNEEEYSLPIRIF
jgi:hypothetical protein